MLVCLRCAPFWFFQPLSTLPFFPPFFQYFIYSTFFHSFFPIFAFQATFGLHSFSRYDHKGKKLQAKKTVHQYYSFILCTIITFFCIQKMIILVERERESRLVSFFGVEEFIYLYKNICIQEGEAFVLNIKNSSIWHFYFL